jgi:3-hydroxyisobutyrate dehydrogenase
MKQRIAFLGLGNMGTAMATRLVKAGFPVTVYNRTAAKAKPLVRLGARLAATPREAAEGASVIFAMLADDHASREVWLGRDGALKAQLPREVWAVECSTLSHGCIKRLAARMEKRGLRFVDCPVTGIPSQAARGELTLFLGCDKQDITALRAVFKPLSTSLVHFGPVGTANAYKLLINLMGTVQIGALAEGLVMAERAGLDVKQVAAAICRGAAASPQVIRHSRAMRQKRHDREIVFSGALRLKDTLYGLDLARRYGLDARLGKASVRVLRELEAAGLGAQNESKIIDLVRARR